jgi:Endoplasmic reticulum vesicle transporter/Endoplasmic Reticulum-Golgi Intermediate Compartment (ERGIC)
MPALRKLDAFVKTRPELRTKSALGGLITLCAGSTAGVLLVAQLVLYIAGSPQHALHLSKSRPVPMLPLHPNHLAMKMLENAGKIPLDLLVTFPHIPCSQLDVNHDGASISTGDLQKAQAKNAIQFRIPTRAELSKIGATTISSTGCTVEGHLRIPIVAGSLAVTLSSATWIEATRVLAMGMFFNTNFLEESKEQLKRYNTSHYIHHLRFGQSFPHADHYPLENRPHINSKDSITVDQVLIKLVPTLYPSWLQEKQSYQLSVSEHQITAESLIMRSDAYLPGLRVSYDFTPLAIHQSSGRSNFLVFLSSLISIVGGVFVTVGLVTGLVIHSAQAVSKKVD